MQNTLIDKYTKEVEQLVESLPPLDERKRIIEELDEECFKEVGEHLPAMLLELLGTWLLNETYTDTRCNKVALEEYPILSEHQLYRRGRKRVLIQEEATLDALQYHRTTNNLSNMDKNTKRGQRYE
jgi:hypothetical protein